MTTTDQQYIPLRAGDKRQEGDEKRETPQAQTGYQGKNAGVRHAYGVKNRTHDLSPPGPWEPVTNLLGHVILPADLILHEYRRPLP